MRKIERNSKFPLFFNFIIKFIESTKYVYDNKNNNRMKKKKNSVIKHRGNGKIGKYQKFSTF